MPYEIYDLTVKLTWLRIGALAINLLLVIYLAWSKRLLGVRGGKKAYEAQLRAESVIEVEQAALAPASAASATSAAQPGQGAPSTFLAKPHPVRSRLWRCAAPVR